MLPVRKSQNWLPSLFSDFFGNEWLDNVNSTTPAVNIIENDDELDLYKDLIEKSENISITAGASTPQSVIERVVRKIKQGE